MRGATSVHVGMLRGAAGASQGFQLLGMREVGFLRGFGGREGAPQEVLPGPGKGEVGKCEAHQEVVERLGNFNLQPDPLRVGLL